MTELLDEQNARGSGTEFLSNEEVSIASNQLLVVAGPRFQAHLEGYAIRPTDGWIAVQDGFFAKPMTPEEYIALKARLSQG